MKDITPIVFGLVVAVAIVVFAFLPEGWQEDLRPTKCKDVWRDGHKYTDCPHTTNGRTSWSEVHSPDCPMEADTNVVDTAH